MKDRLEEIMQMSDKELIEKLEADGKYFVERYGDNLYIKIMMIGIICILTYELGYDFGKFLYYVMH